MISLTVKQDSEHYATALVIDGDGNEVASMVVEETTGDGKTGTRVEVWRSESDARPLGVTNVPR